MSKAIEIIIKDGKISLEVQGIDDASCADLTRALEQALGDVENIQRKPNYYVELDGIKNYQFEE